MASVSTWVRLQGLRDMFSRADCAQFQLGTEQVALSQPRAEVHPLPEVPGAAPFGAITHECAAPHTAPARL